MRGPEIDLVNPSVLLFGILVMRLAVDGGARGVQHRRGVGVAGDGLSGLLPAQARNQRATFRAVGVICQLGERGAYAQLEADRNFELEGLVVRGVEIDFLAV